MGPLSGIRVIEIGGIGPGPFCGMLLADLGADVIRVERAADDGWPVARDPHRRNRRSLALNLRQPQAVQTLLRLIERSDACFEGFRPGVAERLGFGPDVCLARNPRLVFGRMTGWGQEGPLAQAAGHDINYIALTGALHAVGTAGGKPVPPLNMLGDFGGGGLLLAFGMLAALLEARSSGRGQVVDAAMVDGAAALVSACLAYRENGIFDSEDPGQSLLGGAAHFYDSYETSDGKYVAIASIEPPFYEQLIERLGLDRERFGPAMAEFRSGAGDPAQWKALKAELAQVFRQKTRDEWCALLEGTDACFAPVLKLSEAPDHPHAQARQAYVDVGGRRQCAPAPRFSRTPAAAPRPPRSPGQDTDEVLRECGLSQAEIEGLRELGALA